jgi:hypothetical protein
MISSTLKKISQSVSKTLGEPTADAHHEAPTEAGVYKSLLVELQYNQLLISREYQQLFKDKEEEIRRLKKLVGEPITEGDGVESSKKTAKEGAKPLKDTSPEEMKAVLKEWDRKMKANIVQKTEALAEAQIYRESVELLRAQLDNLKETIKNQERQLKEYQGTSKKPISSASYEQSRADQQAGMDKLMAAFTATQDEMTKTKELLEQAELENEALRLKAESDAKTLEIMSKSTPPGDSETQKIFQQREEEWNRKIQEIRDDAQAKQAKVDEDLKEAKAILSESQATVAKLQADLANAFEMQNDMVARTKQAADEELASAASERDEAVAKLRDGEARVKDALAKLAKAEAELARLTRDHDELLVSRNLSSQQDLEMKESALESTRKELEIVQRSVDELRASSDALVASLQAELAAKVSAIETLTNENDSLVSEKNMIAKKFAENLEQSNQLKSELDELSRSHTAELEQIRVENEAESKKAEAKIHKFTQESNDLKEQNQQLQVAVHENARRLEAIDAELASSKKSLAEAVEERTKLNMSSQMLGERINDCQVKCPS